MVVAQFVHARDEDSGGCSCSPEDQLWPAPRQQELAAETGARFLPCTKKLFQSRKGIVVPGFAYQKSVILGGEALFE